MKKYFVYELKRCLIPFIIIAFLGILFCTFPVALSEGSYSRCMDYLGYLSFVLGGACMIMPIWLFSYKMGKRSTDLFYSLPLTRTKQLLVHFITGFITIIAAYTIAYWLSFMMYAIKFGTNIELIYFLPLYFSVIIPAYVIYAISCFAFTRANSVFDGVVFIIFAMLAVFAVVAVISTFTSYEVTHTNEWTTDEGILKSYTYTNTENYIYYTAFFPFYALDLVTTIFEGLISNYSLSRVSPLAEGLSEAVSISVSMGLFTVLAGLATAVMILTEHKCKAENCNQVSESVFGYKVMIPLALFAIYAVLGKYWLDDIETVVLHLIVLASAYGLTAIYKKSFKIGWKPAIAIVCSAVLGTALSFITPGLF